MSFQLVAGTAWFSGISIGETDLHLRCKGKLDSSRLKAGELALISRLVGVNVALLELWLESQGSSQVEMGISGNLLSCIKGVHHTFDFQVGTRDFCQGAAGKKGLIAH